MKMQLSKREKLPLKERELMLKENSPQYWMYKLLIYESEYRLHVLIAIIIVTKNKKISE